MNPHFRKGGKAKQGSGHLWVLADYDKEDQISQLHIQHSQQHQNQSIIIQNEGQTNNISENTILTGSEKASSNVAISNEAYIQQDRVYKVSNASRILHFSL